MYIISDNEATYFEGEALGTEDQLPAGAWGVGYRPMTNAPYFYKIADYKTSHGKIYGDAESFAKHVCESYDIEKDKNVGALFSGNKGLGKSLTIRLIIEHYIKTKPIIVVDQYTNLLPNVLSDLKDCVVVLDEFEKMFKKNDDEGMTPQESLLSVLDGTKSLSHNLYLLSVNDIFSLDENLISRPGRIRYHYVYESEDASVVKDYCKDNLNDKSKIEDVVNVLGSIKYVSMDIISSFVDELNKFPNLSPADVREYFNLDVSNSKLKYSVLMKTPNGNFTYSKVTSSDSSEIWLNMSNLDYKKLLKSKGIKEDSDEADNLDYMSSIKITINDVPPVYGVHKLLPDEFTINALAFQYSANLPFDESEGYEVLSATITDPEFASYTKKYHKNSL